MIDRRPFDKLGGADHGWLKAKHHFSFARYYDPKRLGHGALRVWNDDEIAPNRAFPRTRMPIWRSSPMSGRARSRMRTTSAIKAEPRPVMSR